MDIFSFNDEKSSINLKIILKNHSTTDSVGCGFFGFGFDFARNPLLFLWIFHFEIHTHPITRSNPLF
jgi:hypothetical protein